MLETPISKSRIVSAETIEVIAQLHSITITCLIQAFKQPTIQEWNFCKQIDNFLLTDRK